MSALPEEALVSPELCNKTLDIYADLLRKKREGQVDTEGLFLGAEHAAVIACHALTEFHKARWDTRLQEELALRGVAMRLHTREERHIRLSMAYGAVPVTRAFEPTIENAITALLPAATFEE